MALHQTTCPLDCPDACGVLVESDEQGRFARLRGNPAHGYSRGVLCGKTARYGELITSPDRLVTPLVREGAELRPCTWDEALDRIAARVAPLAGEDVLALPYAGSMGVAARKFPMRAMHALGATLHDGGICDSTSTAGHDLVYGDTIGADLEQLDEADALVFWGCDAARTLQHALPAVRSLCAGGAPVVGIDVYRTDTIARLEKWGGGGLVIRPGSDAALALCLTRLAFERGAAERAFLARECLGGERFEQHVRGAPDLAEAARVTGLAPEEIERLYELLTTNARPFVKVGIGWTRRRNGGMGMRAVLSLMAVLGRAERVHYESLDLFGLAEDVIERPDLRPRPMPPKVRQIELGRELCAGRFRAAFVWGHNPAVTVPDSGPVRRGLARDDLFLVVHEHFLTETAQLADLVLPATFFAEHSDVYRSYGQRVLQYGRRAVAAPEGPRSNVATFAAIATALDLPEACRVDDPDRLCMELLAASRARIGEEAWPRVLAGDPVKLAPRPGAARGTPSGRIELYSETAAALGQPPMATYVPDEGAEPERAFWLLPAPSVATHNSTFSHSPRHVARMGPPTCWVATADAARLGLADGDRVAVENARGRLTLRVGLTGDLPSGVLRIDGLPRAQDVPEGVGVNVLVSNEPSDVGDGNTQFSTRVDLRKVEPVRTNGRGRS